MQIIMDNSRVPRKGDPCYCIYELIDCNRNFDCVSCEIANRYWDEMREQVLISFKEKKSEQENIEVINTRTMH
jgi:hypothetical protein